MSMGIAVVSIFFAAFSLVMSIVPPKKQMNVRAMMAISAVIIFILCFQLARVSGQYEGLLQTFNEMTHSQITIYNNQN